MPPSPSRKPPAGERCDRLRAGYRGRGRWAGVDPNFEARELQTALRRAIATCRGSCDGTVDDAGWVVLLMSPEEQQFCGKSLEDVLAWYLVWLMRPELGVGPFVL